MRPPSSAHPRPWHRHSIFGSGPRHPLARDSRTAWRARLELARRDGRLTSLHCLVGHALIKRLGQDGRCDPSHATLAQDAGCSERSVQRALARLRELGLVAWTCRIVRAGWRAVQTSNAYQLVLAAVQAPPLFSSRPLNQLRTGFTAKLSVGADVGDRAEALAALASRASAMTARFNQAWKMKMRPA